MCGSCTVFSLLDKAGDTYAQNIFKILAQPTVFVVTAVFSAWFLMKLFQAYYGEIKWKQSLTTAALFILITSILYLPNFYYSWIYDLPKSTMSQLTQIFVKNSTANLNDDTFAGIVKAADDSMTKVGALVNALFKESGIMRGLTALVGALILGAPYLYLWALFLIQIALGFFKVIVMAAVSPLLIAAWIFPATRGFALTGIRLILSGVFGVAAAGIVMGITFNVIDQVLVSKGYDPATGEFAFPVNNYVFSAPFWSIFFVLTIAIHFHKIAPSLVTQITGTNEIMGGPSIISKIAGAVGSYAAGKAMAVAGPVAGALKTAAMAAVFPGQALGSVANKVSQFLKNRQNKS